MNAPLSSAQGLRTGKVRPLERQRRGMTADKYCHITRQQELSYNDDKCCHIVRRASPGVLTSSSRTRACDVDGGQREQGLTAESLNIVLRDDPTSGLPGGRDESILATILAQSLQRHHGRCTCMRFIDRVVNKVSL